MGLSGDDPESSKTYTVLRPHTKNLPVLYVLSHQSARGRTFCTDTITGCFGLKRPSETQHCKPLRRARKRDIQRPSLRLQAAFKTRQNSLFCSSSLISSGTILSLSTWSRSTLAHFCSDSMMVQGLDMSTANTAKQLEMDCGERANFSRPLWYRSPSRIHTLQRVRSAEEKSSGSVSVHVEFLVYTSARKTHRLCPHRGHLSTDTPGRVLSYCAQLLAV